MVGLGNARRVASFDWDWRSLRICQAEVSGSKVRVRSVVSRPMEAGLAYGDPEGLGKFIRRVLNEERVSAKRAIVDIPRDQAVLNTLTLPAAEEEELARLVRFQIVRELPFPLGEAVADFAAEPPGQDGQQRVLVAAVRNDVLEFYRQVFIHAGLKLERIGLRPYANLVALAQAVPDAAEGRTLFVDVGPTLTEIDIVAGGRLVFSRAADVNVLPRAAERIAQGESEGEGEPDQAPGEMPTAIYLKTNTEDIVKSLLVEVTRTLEAYRATEPEGKVDRVIVGGSCGVESDLARALQATLRVPCGKYHPPDKALKYLHNEVPLTAFAAALGLVLSQTDRTGRRFDFLHPKEPEAVHRQLAKRLPMVAATVALALLSGAIFFWRTEVAPKRARLALLTEQADYLKPVSKEMAKFGQLVADISAFDKSEVVWIDEMYRLISVLPDSQEVYAAQWTMKDSGRVRLKLMARDNRTANLMATKLSEMRTPKGRPRYVARTGTTRKGKAGKYPFSTEVNVEFYQKESKKKKRRR